MGYSAYGKAPSAWSETALVTISEEGGNDIHFRTITDTIDFDLGEKGFDTIGTVYGGKLVKFTPQTDSTVTLDLYPVAAGSYWSSSGEEAAGFFDLLHTRSATYDPGNPSSAVAYQAITSDTTRTRYRIAVLWTNDTATTSAMAALTSGNYAGLRIACCGWFTKVAPSFTDDILKVTVTMKIPALKKDTTANIQVASTDKSSVTNLTALVAFASSTNF